VSSAATESASWKAVLTKTRMAVRISNRQPDLHQGSVRNYVALLFPCSIGAPSSCEIQKGQEEDPDNIHQMPVKTDVFQFVEVGSG